jgi:integrase
VVAIASHDARLGDVAQKGAKRKPRRHRRGEGTTYKDTTADRWVAVLRLGTDPKTGKRRTVKATARKGGDRHDAESLLSRLQRQYGRGGDVALMGLDAYLEEWLQGASSTLAPSSVTLYRHHIDKHIGPLLGGIRVGALHQRDVRRLIDDRLRAGLSAATVGHIVATLRNALGQAVSDGDLTTNVAMVELPRVDRPPVEAMTPAMAQAILRAVQGDGTPEHPPDRLAALWTLLLGTGLRLGEACALDWRDVVLGDPTSGRQGSVTVRKGKTKAASRTIPLPAFVVAALQRHKVTTPRYGAAEPVFMGERTYKRLTVGVASHAFPKLMTNAGLPRITPHKLRHGTATLLHQQGVPMRDIADILGHSSPSITARTYAHVSQDSRRKAMDTLDEGLG